MAENKTVSNKSVAEWLLEKMQENERERESMIASFGYINWLESFTEENPCFCDDNWLYKQDEILPEDLRNVERLSSFWSALDAYCTKYLIDTEVADATFFTRCICIKHNGIGYVFEIVHGQGTVLCVTREKPEEHYIDFTAIMDDVKPDGYEERAKMLGEFAAMIEKMKEKKIPADNVGRLVKKYFKV